MRRVHLHLSPSFGAAWDKVVGPWFDDVSAKALAGEGIFAVVVPTQAFVGLARTNLLEHGISLAGIRFLTPARLREILLRRIDANLPLREHLRLLLSIAAHEGLHLPADQAGREARMQDPEFLTAKSIARAPDNFLRLLDQLGAAGASFPGREFPAAPVIERFVAQVKACGFELVHQTDRRAARVLPGQEPIFSNLFIAGFNSAHWPLWPLLSTAAKSSSEATVLLEYPREAARTIDEAWVGTWEECFDTAKPVEADPQSGRFAGLVRPNEKVPSDVSLPVVVGLNATEQAEGIATAALRFLEDPTCNRLGILFPRAGALSRLVSVRLRQAGIPHRDGLGHPAPGDFENSALQAWFELQEKQQLAPLLRFLETLPSASDFLGGLLFSTYSDRLRRAYRAIVIDDITVLREACARKEKDPDSTRVAEQLAQLKFLSSHSTLPRFLSETKTAFGQFKWREAWAEVERLSGGWAQPVHAEFPRTIYLRWLREILDSKVKTRDPLGDQSYARVQLLPYAEAEGYQFSHLILAGLNQGEWPPPDNESGFLRDEDVDRINRDALKQGKQGEGHSTAVAGRTLLLGSQQQRQIAVRQFAAALDSTSDAVVMTASLLHESAPERWWNPSEFLSQAYFSAAGKVLSQETMGLLRERTRSWLQTSPLRRGTKVSGNVANQTRTAYDARRQLAPAGEYEFALRQPIDREVTLRATQWDRVTKTPALVWLRIFLGTESDESNLNEWSTATGEWVHKWLAQISPSAAQNAFTAVPSTPVARERVRAAAKRSKDEIIELCFACGRTAPDWWLSAWGNALALADCLALKIGESGDWPQMASEWVLESPQLITVRPDASLRFRGRIDLLLSGSGSEPGLGGRNLWVVDYKTGSNKSLAVSAATPDARAAAVAKRLVKGDAIQLGLYALAARELGAGEIAVSLISPRVDLDRPQLRIEDLVAPAEFWQALFRMQESGVFGMRGPVRSAFSFANSYPLATLQVDEELLEDKWALTHPALIDEEEEWG